jgi:hypothetical protein
MEQQLTPPLVLEDVEAQWVIAAEVNSDPLVYSASHSECIHTCAYTLLLQNTLILDASGIHRHDGYTPGTWHR